MNKATPGQLICIDSGEYSDYSVDGFFVALEAFNPREKLEEFMSSQENRGWGQTQAFIGFLIKAGLLMEVKYTTFYLGSYNLSDAHFHGE